MDETIQNWLKEKRILCSLIKNTLQKKLNEVSKLPITETTRDATEISIHISVASSDIPNMTSTELLNKYTNNDVVTQIVNEEMRNQYQHKTALSVLSYNGTDKLGFLIFEVVH
jgi:hypothetical protein